MEKSASPNVCPPKVRELADSLRAIGATLPPPDRETIEQAASFIYLSGAALKA